MNSKKHIILIAVGVLFLSLLAVGSAVAGGNGVATDFEAVDVACELVDAGENFVKFEGIVLSDDERMAGTSTVKITFLDNGKFDVEATYSPDAFDGMWVAPGQGQDTPAGLAVKHHGYGTGDLEGWRIVFQTAGVTPIDPPICDPIGNEGVILVGKIITPGEH